MHFVKAIFDQQAIWLMWIVFYAFWILQKGTVENWKVFEKLALQIEWSVCCKFSQAQGLRIAAAERLSKAEKASLKAN